MAQQYKKLMENFRISIRRKQIDEMFCTQRHELLRQQNQKNKQAFQFRLRDYESRENWVREIALKLEGFPSQDWQAFMNQLYYALRFYENQFDVWVREGIAKAICELFKKEYLELGLYKLAANILTDILYLNLKNQNPRVIKSFFQLKFVDDVLRYLLINPTVEYIRLMAIACEAAPNIRNLLIVEGLLQFVVFKLSKKQRASLKAAQLNNLLSLVNSLIKTHQLDSSTYVKPRKSTILALLPVLSAEIEENHPSSNFLIIFQSLKQLCLARNQEIFDYLLQYPKIFDKSLEMICYEKRTDVRLKSVNFISMFLLSENPQHTRFLADKRVLDRLYESYYLANNRDENRLAILAFLSNFTADFIEFQEMVMLHPAMKEIIVNEAANSYRQEIRREAVYCISNILRRLKDQNEQLMHIVSQLKIGETLMQNIHRHDRDGESVIEILNLWRQIVIANSKSSLIHDLLIGRLGVMEMLEDIVQTEDLEDNIGEFLNFYHDLE